MEQAMTGSAQASPSERIGIKNISDWQIGFSANDGRNFLVQPGQGVIVTRREYELYYQGAKTVNGDIIWKVVPPEEVQTPEVFKLKTLEGQEPDRDAIDDTFLDGLGAIFEVSSDTDLAAYLATCSSVKTLQALLVRMQKMDNVPAEKRKATIAAIIGQLTTLKRPAR